jgi:phenylacetate-CoA ligase
LKAALTPLYHRLPGPVQSVAASAFGYWLRRRRYGPETPRLVEEALERERWSTARLRGWTEERLAYALDRAVRRVPFYRDLWSARRIAGDRRSWERLEHWPLLEKQTLRKYPEAFVANDCDPRCMFVERTSGTTGTPLKLYRTRRTLRAAFAIYEARRRRWFGISRGDRWALAGGQLVAPRERTSPPFWVWNHGLRQLYISSYHLAPGQARASLEAIRFYGCRSLWGYPSSLAALATVAREPLSDVRVLITVAEPLTPSQRERIEQAFRVPVRETYGLVELVAAGGECEAGGMHAFPEFGFTESIEGELVSTSLLDLDMPLIRYRTGDAVAAASSPSACSCGRSLPLLGAIEGRCDDIFWTADGRPVGRLSTVVKGDLPVVEAQFVQETLGRVRVIVAPAPGYGADTEQFLRRALSERLGAMTFQFELVERVPRGPNGKFRASESRLRMPPLEKEKAAGC